MEDVSGVGRRSRRIFATFKGRGSQKDNRPAAVVLTLYAGWGGDGDVHYRSLTYCEGGP